MTKRYDICTPRKGKDDRTFWTRIGTAFQGEKGIQLIFDALPLPDAEGRCVANLFEPREKSNAPAQAYGGNGRQPATAGLDDESPF